MKYLQIIYSPFTPTLTLQEEDVTGTLSLLSVCAKYYQEGRLTGECGAGGSRCRGVPPLCAQHNAVFTILHYLTDLNFSKLQVRSLKLFPVKMKYLYYKLSEFYTLFFMFCVLFILFPSAVYSYTVCEM